MTKSTRNDYVVRMKEVYDENNKMVKETKEIIDVMQQKQ